MDAQGVGTVQVELNHTLAELLAKLCIELDTEDYTGVLSRALGLLEMVQRTKRQGGRLMFVNERGDTADVVF
jgi:pimeloyl-CoA synthetase